MLSVNGKKNLQNFAAGLRLQLSNIDIPTRISNNNRSLIDHCFSTNEQITGWKVCLPPLDINHNVIFFQSELFLLEEKQNYFIEQDTKIFVDEKFNRDLAFADWRRVYQQRNCDEMFAEFNRIFLTILEKNAPTEKELVSNMKRSTSEKPWVTREIQHLVAEKHRYFNDYKLTQSAQSFVSFKKFRNLVNRKLKEAQNQFSEDFLKKIETSKENWKFIKKKIGKKNNSPIITEIDENGRIRKDKKSICHAFNRVFSKMGIYRGQIVPLNVKKIVRKFQEFNIRPFTLREIYKLIDNLENNEAPRPGYINAWALKSGKIALGKYLQIIFNDGIQEKAFSSSS